MGIENEPPKKRVRHRRKKEKQSPEPTPNLFLQTLSRDVARILENGELLYDLAGKRLALTALSVKKYFEKTGDTWRVGIVGFPNRGKTTLTYSCAEILGIYGVTSQYYDLDPYTNSGEAIAGKISWGQRKKRSDISREEIFANIQGFLSIQKGVVWGDFPGLITDPFHPERLETLDLAIILVDSLEEKEKWEQMISGKVTSYIWVRSDSSEKATHIQLPTQYDLERTVKFRVQYLCLINRVLVELMSLRGIPLPEIWQYFSQAERTVLEEILDFMYVPDVIPDED